jgi:hypothetical protein
VHCWEPQSPFEPQGAPWLHVGEQLGGWQTLLVHTNDSQSPLLLHGLPFVHLGEQTGGAH